MPRMQILTASEQAAFDKPPLFDYRERKQFFSLPKGLMDIATTLRTPDGQIGFLVMCGYFKATRRFYQPQDFHKRDIETAAKVLELRGSDFSPDAYAKQTRARHQQLILDFYGFAPFDEAARKSLAVEIASMARMHLKPRLIFDRCLDFLAQRRIQIPTVRSLTDRVRIGLHERKAELVMLMDAHLTDVSRGLLDGLFTAPDDQNRYRLTLLKKLSQSTKPTRIKEGVADFETLAALYDQLEGILSVLDLGMAGIRYFAGSVLKSRLFQLQQRSEADRYVHAAAFVAHQFFRCQDNLADLWLSVMASFQATTAREHKEWLLENRKEQQEQLKTIVNDLDASVFALIREVRRLTDADDLSNAQKVVAIRTLLDRGQNGAFERLKANLDKARQDRSWHDVLEDHSLRLQNRLSPILRALTFEPNERAAALIVAINHFKTTDGHIGDRAPANFLDADERAALTREDGTFRPSLYKVLLFQHVTGAIKSGDLNLAQSYKYRPMDAYLIDPERWKREKEHLLERAGLAQFAEPDPVLAKLDAALDAQYRATNDRVADNPHLKFRTDGTFHVATPALHASETDPLGELFPQRHDVPLAQVLDTINNHCGMLNAFEHWQQTHIRQTASHPTLLAGIMGLGCGIGVRKMARISSRVTENELEHAVNWRFSLDNIRAANDAVLGAMNEMELPNLYRREAQRFHTASDGQKFEVQGKPAPPYRRPLAHDMGAYQHAWRVRFLR